MQGFPTKIYIMFAFHLFEGTKGLEKITRIGLIEAGVCVEDSDVVSGRIVCIYGGVGIDVFSLVGLIVQLVRNIKTNTAIIFFHFYLLPMARASVKLLHCFFIKFLYISRVTEFFEDKNGIILTMSLQETPIKPTLLQSLITVASE